MGKLKWVLLSLAGVVGGAHLLAKSAADTIKQRPEKFDRETLFREPVGETHFVRTSDGTILRAVTAGEGPQTVVFTHGYGASLLEWNLIWSALLAQGGYRLIAYDLRGHEQSTQIGYEGVGSAPMATDCKAILDYFDVRDGIMVSHSTGCFLTVLFLLTYPEAVAQRLRGVVLMGGLVGQASKDNPQNQLQIPLIQSGLMTRVARSSVYGVLFGASIYGDEPTLVPVDVFREMFAKQNHLKLVPLLQALVDEDYYGRLHEINLPAVVVCGENDQTTPRWHSEQMGERIPNARSVWVPKVGHMLNWEAPEVIIEAIQSLAVGQVETS